MAGTPSSKAHKTPDVPAEVDLKPVMGLVAILIPLLLYTFSFYKIQVQPVSAPKIGAAGPGNNQGDNKKKPLQLTVVVTKPGFAIKMDPEVAGSVNLPSSISIPKKVFKDPRTGKRILEYDYPALYQKLYEIKKHFKEEQTVHITGAPNIRWQIIARVIDTARFILKKDHFKDLNDFATAKVDTETEGKKIIPRFLFPQVVFVVME